MDKYARWLTDKYICIMLLIFPLWTGTVGYTGITRPKFLFFALLTGLWLAALLACALFLRCKPSRPRGFQLAALAFMAAACLSALFSKNIQYSILGSNRCDGLVTLLLYGGIALGVSRWGEFKERYVNLSALAAGLCAVVCILQLCRVNVLGLFPEGLDFYDAGTRYTGEFLGTMGNTNVLAAWFCLVIPLLTVSALRSRPVRAALLLLVAAACLGLLFYIEALSGLVGCLGCALVTAPCYVNQTGRRRAARILLAAEAAACLAGLALVYFTPPGNGMLWELSEILHGGPDSFGLRSTVEFSRFVPETGATLSTHADNAHCEPLGYLVNLGIPGFAAYCALAVLSLRRWLRGADPALGAGLLCYLVQSLFGLGLCLVAPIAWIYMGLLCSEREAESNAG